MVVETVKSDVPDLISVTASLKGEKYIQEGASLFISFRRGPPFPGEPHLTWTIHGEKGEIKFTAEGGTTPRTIASKPVNITLHDFFTKQVQVIEWSWNSQPRPEVLPDYMKHTPVGTIQRISTFSML
jgi:hypothetical protein